MSEDDADLTRLQRTAGQAARLDFFNSGTGPEVETLMATIKKHLRPPSTPTGRLATARTDLKRMV